MPAPMIAMDFIDCLRFSRFEWVSYGRLTDLDEYWTCLSALKLQLECRHRYESDLHCYYG